MLRVAGSKGVEATESALVLLPLNLLSPLPVLDPPRWNWREERSCGRSCKSQQWSLVCLDLPQCSHLRRFRSSKEVLKCPL